MEQPMDNLSIANDAFVVECCPFTGSIRQLRHPRDENRMNWVVDSEESPWHALGAGWGLGYASRQYSRCWRWGRAAAVECRANSLRARYEMGELAMDVLRDFDELGRLRELYTLRNISQRELKLDTIGIYAPFNDNYPSAGHCITRRCNAHIWCGDDVAWACALRMGGMAPHLGLAMTRGRLVGYGIEHRDTRSGSNIRGDIVLLACEGQCASPDVRSEPLMLAAGESWSIGWTLFWHDGWDNFHRQAASLGVPRIRGDRFAAEVGEPIRLSVAAPVAAIAPQPPEATAATHSSDGPGTSIQVVPACCGLHRVDLKLADGRRTHAVVLATPPVEELLRRRVAFIVGRQQVRDEADGLHGALLPYDNDAQRQVRSDINDRNEGRERVGMGVLLAAFLRRMGPDQAVREALEMYARFVRQRLQDQDGNVLNGVGQKPWRKYNYPWVADFWLQMHAVTHDDRYLDWYVQTTHAYYNAGGEHFYAIGVPMLEGLLRLRQAGRDGDAQKVLARYRAHGAMIAANGIDYPSHEVTYEQSIVGPAATMLLELALATGEREYLDAARPHLRCLEAFGGDQPDVRLNDIAIRHWDGYWFGRDRLWGDTMPHYWSCITAMAFLRYWQVTGDQAFARRARNIVGANLAQFQPDGSATCAMSYPLSIDGRPGRCRDPYANDQDWALVFWLMVDEATTRQPPRS
jgi:hypothetical protein